MLKISLIENRTRRLLVLEGKLIAPWSGEFRSACQQARTDLDGRKLVVVMKHVTTISQEGENVILELIKQGIRFCPSGVFARHMLRQLTRRARRNLLEAKE